MWLVVIVENLRDCVGVSVLQTHLSLSFCSLGHSFIPPTSDFREKKKKYEKKAF